MSMVTKEIRAKAEIVQGKWLCQAASKKNLKEMGIPIGLLPLEDIEECGLVKDTGFIWLKQKKLIEHKFEMIGKFAQYANEVTAFIEPNKLKEVTGIKAKELFIWITVNEVFVHDHKVIFKTPMGLSKTFPIEVFQIKMEENDVCHEI